MGLEHNQVNNTLFDTVLASLNAFLTNGADPGVYVAPVEPTPAGAYVTSYTVPADKKIVVEMAVVFTLGTPLVDVHLIPSGGSEGTDNALGISVQGTPGGVPWRSAKHVLEAGGVIKSRNTAAVGNTATVHSYVKLYDA